MISSIPSKRSRKKKKYHITYVGRVVYERKKHLFTIKDILRISARLSEPQSLDEALLQMGLLVKIIINILRAINRFLKGFEFAWGLVDLIMKIAQEFMTELIQGKAEEFLRELHIIGGPSGEIAAAPEIEKVEVKKVETLGDIWYWTDPVTGFKWERVWGGLH